MEQLSFIDTEETKVLDVMERSEEDQKEFDAWRKKKKEAKARFTAMQNLPYKVKLKRAELRAIEFMEQMEERGCNAHPHCFRDDTCGGMGEGDCNTCDFSKQVCERLAAYERTGLTVKEIKMVLQINQNLVNQLERRWIPVTERLPESGQEILAYIKHNYAEDGWRAYRVYEYTDHWVGMGNLCEVIAWMPLPEPYRPESLREAGQDAAQGGLMPGA